MPRIDAPIATQVADLVRPAQNGRDVQLQAETARAKTARPDPDEDGALSTATPSADDIRAAADQLKQVVEVASGRQLRFDIDDDTRSFLVKVKDQATGDVIKQIPSEEILSLRQRLDELVGMLVDKTA
jgi:flagellar protein FlaG